MSGFPYNSAYLLRLMKRYLGRPQQADAISPSDYYERLTDAQMQVVSDIASIMPEVLYPTVTYASIPTLTTVDGGLTFTFGLDANGFALSPMGSVGIYRSLNDIPDNPMEPGRDYIPLGGTAIQMPNNVSYTGTLYWRGMSPPGTIDATNQPVLFPEGARELIALRAAINFASEGARNPTLFSLLSSQYGYPLAQNPGRFAWWCQEWATQYQGGGALGAVTGLQIALGSSMNYGGYGM